MTTTGSKKNRTGTTGNRSRTNPKTTTGKIKLPAIPKILRDLATMDDEPKTFSIMILDASGSMRSYGDVPQKCINEYLESLKNPPDGRKQYCTVVVFNDDYQAIIKPSLAAKVKPITNYCADGCTLLWETVYKALKNYRALYGIIQPENLKIFVGVFSDGQDNKSFKDRQPRKLKAMAKAVQALGWELFCYGIGIDGKKLAQDMGFPTDDDHCQTVEANDAGVQATTQHFTAATTTCFHLDPKLFGKK
ncbi:MAG: hypothetical protein WC654_08045 [Patescibacteria group bacterium]